MNKKTIGKELKLKLEKNCNTLKISRWAFHVFSDNINSLTPDLRSILEMLFSMEDDPQFELTSDGLTKLADKLIEEGEKEELGESIPEIKDIAKELGEEWLMCPLCQEAWESRSKYSMVRCPKCSSLLHNPQNKK